FRAACNEAGLGHAFDQLTVEAEHPHERLFDGGDLLRARLAAPGNEQHQDRRGITRIIDCPQAGRPGKLARVGLARRLPATGGQLSQMVQAVHSDEPVEHPEGEREHDDGDNRHGRWTLWDVARYPNFVTTSCLRAFKPLRMTTNALVMRFDGHGPSD